MIKHIDVLQNIVKYITEHFLRSFNAQYYDKKSIKLYFKTKIASIILELLLIIIIIIIIPFLTRKHINDLI